MGKLLYPLRARTLGHVNQHGNEAGLKRGDMTRNLLGVQPVGSSFAPDTQEFVESVSLNVRVDEQPWQYGNGCASQHNASQPHLACETTVPVAHVALPVASAGSSPASARACGFPRVARFVSRPSPFSWLLRVLLSSPILLAPLGGAYVCGCHVCGARVFPRLPPLCVSVFAPSLFGGRMPVDLCELYLASPPCLSTMPSSCYCPLAPCPLSSLPPPCTHCTVDEVRLA